MDFLLPNSFARLVMDFFTALCLFSVLSYMPAFSNRHSKYYCILVYSTVLTLKCIQILIMNVLIEASKQKKTKKKKTQVTFWCSGMNGIYSNGRKPFVHNNLVCSWEREQHPWNHLTENSRNARSFTKSLQLPCIESNHAELTAITSSKDLHNEDLEEGLVLSMLEWFKENEGTYFFMMHYVTTERAMWGIQKTARPTLGLILVIYQTNI